VRPPPPLAWLALIAAEFFIIGLLPAIPPELPRFGSLGDPKALLETPDPTFLLR